MLIEIFLVILSYLLGSIPCGLLLGKFCGIGDIRQKGSGNIGATNMLRIGGRKLGIITLVLDALKGFIPVFLSYKLGFSENITALCALFAVIGHIFPVWLNFKGGKGVATTLAVLSVLHWKICIFSIFIWLFVFFVSRISSLSSIAMLITAATLSIFLLQSIPSWTVFIISLIVLFKHKDNVMRLLAGKEGSFRK